MNFVWILIAQRVISINKSVLCNQNISQFFDFTQGRNLSEQQPSVELPESIKLIRISCFWLFVEMLQKAKKTLKDFWNYYRANKSEKAIETKRNSRKRNWSACVTLHMLLLKMDQPYDRKRNETAGRFKKVDPTNGSGPKSIY